MKSLTPSSSSRPIRVLLVIDHPLVREGLSAVLDQHPEFLVVGEAAGGLAALAEYLRRAPDVLLLDVDVSDMAASETVKNIREIDADARILLLASRAADPGLERALASGGLGFVLKAEPAEGLMAAIRLVHGEPKANLPLGAILQSPHAD